MQEHAGCRAGAPRAEQHQGEGAAVPSETGVRDRWEWNSPEQAVQDARRIMGEHLQRWAVDALRLRSTGLDTPGFRSLEDTAPAHAW